MTPTHRKQSASDHGPFRVESRAVVCTECTWGRALSVFEPRKRCGRDEQLSKIFPERAKVVIGWWYWPHSEEEIAAIRTFLETGDEAVLPEVYRA